MNLSKTGYTHFTYDLLYGQKNLPGCFFSRECRATLISSHPTLVYTCVGCEFAYVKEVKVVKEGGNRDIVKSVPGRGHKQLNPNTLDK